MKNFPCLDLPSDSDDLVLEIDASNNSWCAVLKIKGRKPEAICKYWSRTFKSAELNYMVAT